MNATAYSGDSVKQYITVTSDSHQSVRPVHMLWIVDNSGSMSDEIEGVRSGIAAFVEGLRSYSDQVQVTMITQTSSQTGSNGLSIPADIFQQSHIHSVNFFVDSIHKLHALADYIDRSAALKHKFTNPRSFSEHLSDHPSSDFFRDSEALKVFVVVTDDKERPTDNEKVPAHKAFHSFLMDLTSDLSLFRFYLFAGQQSSLGFIDTEYLELIKILGGRKWQVNGLSPEQWSQILVETKQQIISEVMQRSFDLDHPNKKVKRVSVNGEILTSSDFYVKDDQLHVNEENLKVDDEIEVTYDH